MFQKLTRRQFSFVGILLKLMQQVFGEIDKAELRKLKAKLSQLLQTIVISKLAETFKTYLAELTEVFLDLYLF